MTLRAEDSSEVSLKYATIDLTDGRKLKNVVVKSYDAKSERVLLIADGKAMSLPVAIFPKPLNEQVKSAPASGASVTSVAAPPPRPLVTSADQYMMETAARPPAPQSRPPQRPVTIRSTPDPAAVEAARLRQHLAVAQARAQKFYRYEHQVGSNSITVTSLEFEFEPPKALGYSGRVETKGKAFIGFYDSFGGGSFQRTTSTFEIVTEEDPKEGIKVIDFTRKS
jgi:hypothetical protein